MLICSKCGGKNVSILAWVDANTNEYTCDGPEGVDHKWCDDCQDHCSFLNPEPDIEVMMSDEFYERADEAHKRNGGE